MINISIPLWTAVYVIVGFYFYKEVAGAVDQHINLPHSKEWGYGVTVAIALWIFWLPLLVLAIARMLYFERQQKRLQRRKN